MNAVFLILLVAAAVCFAVAAFAVPSRTRVNFVALGLLLWVLVPLIQQIS